MGRNPATGARIKIPAKTVIQMGVAKAAKEAIVPPNKKGKGEQPYREMVDFGGRKKNSKFFPQRANIDCITPSLKRACYPLNSLPRSNLIRTKLNNCLACLKVACCVVGKVRLKELYTLFNGMGACKDRILKHQI